MKYQKDPYSCGAAAIVNALRCFGRKVSEMKVRSFSNTTSDGTDEKGILNALKSLKFEGKSFELSDKNEALKILRTALNKGNPSILCIQQSQHWVTVVGMADNGTKFIVADPAKTVRNLAENGVYVLSKKELLKTWQWLPVEKPFFGIVVSRRIRKKKEKLST